MAIFGAGSNWDGKEIKADFFTNETFIIGWDISNAQDLYSQIASLKVGDIIYLKSNQPGSLNIKVKGIGIVKEALHTHLFNKQEDLSKTRKDFKLPIKWICQDEFHISIPPDTGKLTNVRAATFYEEYMPYIQKMIIEKIISKLKK